MTEIQRPSFLELDQTEAVALLERNHIGRIAFSFHDRVDIEPIGYVYRDGWIYARTSPGTKLSVVQHHPWIAFQVDEIESPFDWRSVVVHGTIYFPNPERGAKDKQEYDAAAEVLRTIDAGALTSRDLTPERRRILRIHASEILGRQAKSE